MIKLSDTARTEQAQPCVQHDPWAETRHALSSKLPAHLGKHVTALGCCDRCWRVGVHPAVQRYWEAGEPLPAGLDYLTELHPYAGCTQMRCLACLTLALYERTRRRRTCRARGGAML